MNRLDHETKTRKKTKEFDILKGSIYSRPPLGSNIYSRVYLDILKDPIYSCPPLGSNIYSRVYFDILKGSIYSRSPLGSNIYSRVWEFYLAHQIIFGVKTCGFVKSFKSSHILKIGARVHPSTFSELRNTLM